MDHTGEDPDQGKETGGIARGGSSRGEQTLSEI